MWIITPESSILWLYDMVPQLKQKKSTILIKINKTVSLNKNNNFVSPRLNRGVSNSTRNAKNLEHAGGANASNHLLSGKKSKINQCEREKKIRIIY